MKKQFPRIDKMLKNKLELGLRSKSCNLASKINQKNRARQVTVGLGLIDNLSLKTNWKATLNYVERDQSLPKQKILSRVSVVVNFRELVTKQQEWISKKL